MSPAGCTNDPVDKERRKDYCHAILIDPDIDLKKTPEGEEYKQLVYTVGHLDEVEQEKLDTPIKFDDSKYKITE